VSPNTPYQSGDGSDSGNVPPYESHVGGSDPLANNPYSAQHRQAPAPDLDAGAPQLRSSDLRRMNRRALAFLAAIVALLIVMAFFMLKSASNREPPKPHEETLTVPDAPRPLPRFDQTAVSHVPAPIPLALPTPPLPMASQMPSRPEVAHGPTLLQRRIAVDDPAAVGGDGQQIAASQNPNGSPFPGQQGTRIANSLPDKATSAQPLGNPDTLMLRGTYIRCVLETRLISDFPGFTSCVVTEPVYSFNGRKLLLPKGSKVLGKYEGEPTGPRIAVIWDRIVTPNGIDVNMASPGVDNLGGAGHPGHLNSHWVSRISSALLISMLSDAFSYEAAEHGPKTASVTSGVVVETPFQSNTAQTLQNLSNQAVQRAANRPATVTINQGTVVTIYVARDVDFSGVVARF
jgi:type IV secretion system protein VirB10